MEEVRINFNSFKDNIEKLRNTVTNIESSLKENTAFDKTNITPFTSDLENIIKSIRLLEDYKILLNQDIDTLYKIGEEMQIMDEEMSNIYGNQMIR